MPEKILIIKLGAMGDVLRTTVLLRVLEGDVCWVTKKDAIPLLPNQEVLLKRIVEIGKAQELLKDEFFDLVLCLEDDIGAAKLATLVNKNKLIGSYLDSSGNITYTDSSREWFDMGLISKLGKEKADYLKARNKRTYQEMIFKMIGGEFKGEEYAINFAGERSGHSKGAVSLVGIEGRSDKRWPSKQWDKYEQLRNILQNEGLNVRFFEQRDEIQQYVRDLSECDLIITGDTLALHIALALGIKSVSIFTCTSPAEIYGYGRTLKVISPLLDKAFYSRRYIRDTVEAVSLESVYEAVKKMIGHA